MIDKELLKNLDTEDKNRLIETLDTLISQTYSVEEEYKALRNSYETLQAIIAQIIESLPHAIWIRQEDGEIFLQNSSAKNLNQILEHYTFSGKEEIELQSRIYLVSSTKSNDKILITATDITDQKRSERLASMGQVAAHLAHEIRNPIGSISILSSTLLKKVPTPQKPIVLEIKKAIFRVERIIKSTLLFTKGIQPKQTLFPLSALQEEIEEAFENYGYTKEIDLEIDFEERMLWGDLDTLSIVMQNFLYNAIDAIEESEEEHGRISFAYAQDHNYDKIIVKDSGIPIQDPSILYEPFKTTKTKGHGLGLALSLEIIKAHDGKITLLSPEKGFVISIKKEPK